LGVNYELLIGDNTAFKTTAIDHSAIPPRRNCWPFWA